MISRGLVGARDRGSLALVAACLVALPGCYRDFHLVDRTLDGSVAHTDASAPIDGSRRDAGWVEPIGICSEAASVDLLLVIDDSSSMAEEQDRLADALPALVSALAAPPDDDGDGRADWQPIADLHVGVITTDMGSGGYPVPTCGGGTFGARFGDDGVLSMRGHAPRGPCMATYPSILSFLAGDDPAQFAEHVGCVAVAGTSGCGFEQPLEAMLKALSPSGPASYTRADYVPPIFLEGTLGHGDGANAGFVRDGSLLAIVIVTDEEDCSVRDPALLDPSSTTYEGALDLRCFEHPEAVHPVERYVDGLAALRADRPDLLALAVIAGIPPEAAVELPGPDDYDAILSHPAMQERVDPDTRNHLLPSCSVPGVGAALPPPRLVRAAAGLGRGRATVQSICQADFAPAIAPVARLIGRRACVSREVL